jgi:hypothetical protein
MPDILHRVGIRAPSPDQAHQALTTRGGLAAWWTEDTEIVDDLIRFRFGQGGFDMRVIEAAPARRVVWDVIDGPPDWVGTRIVWDLRQDGDFTIVLFRHEAWREPTEFMHHCSTKWATFLLSLKSLIETGMAAPWPNAVRVHDVD